MKDFSFQGKAYIGMRNPDGSVGALTWVGDAGQLQVKMATTTEERQESYSGNRLPSVRLVTAKKANFTLVLNDFSAFNLGFALYGNSIQVTTGTVTAETSHDATAANDDVIALDNRDVSMLTVTDSSSTPKTLVAGTDYNLISAASGLVQILNIGTYVQPFKFAYSYAAAVQLPMFTQGVPERYIVFDGINTVDNNTVKVRLYRAVFDPAAQLDLIDSKLSTLSLAGSILYDSVNAANGALGGFGRIELAQTAA